MIREKIKVLIYNINDDDISKMSAQCAYYTILSFIPFVLLIITLLQYTKIEPQTLFNAILKFIPSNMNEIILNIVQEIYSKSIGTISLSIIFTIWSAGKGLFALIKGIQKIYNKSYEKSSYLSMRIKSIINTIVFIILIVIALIGMVFGEMLINFIMDYFPNLKKFEFIYMILAEAGFIIITFLIFLGIYKFMQKGKVSIKSQVLGAIIGSISLNIVSFIFSRFLLIFKNFSVTYGSLTTLMLIMMWTYSCFYIVFLGAEINKVEIDNFSKNMVE